MGMTMTQKILAAHAGLDSLAQLLQHLIEECASFAHLPDLIRILQADHSATPSSLKMARETFSRPMVPLIFFSRPLDS